jgi:hypothetical protein
VLTASLLAAASFLIVAVESFHKEAGADFFEKNSGSGGFSLLAESEVPFFQDLNQPAVRKTLKLPDSLAQVRFYPCRVRAGDDASCLNLYQPLRPRLLGVPATLIERGGFRFAEGLWTTPAEKDNPWLLLKKPTDDSSIPAFADASNAQWILKVPLGGFVEVPDEQGRKVKLKIVALFQESIFQSELILAESQFLQLFPRQEGFSFFLIESPTESAADIQSALEAPLGELGFTLTSTAKRLEAYLAVENTYLATFQALGGLGLLLGAAGLAIVLLRAVWERRGELALLRALGFRRQALVWLVLAENLFLLLAGLAAGTIAALVAVLPHLSGTNGLDLAARLLGFESLVIAVGLLGGTAAALATLRTPVLTALRRE